ncbi:MAG: RNA-binding transcriptional accessory protein [Desulfobulbaceae bacterium DB1]|nr:MAG: RNA-binding transcriptional accessory protein [Desulfobulbaceae bacterium DB1]
MSHHEIIAREMHLREQQVAAVAALLAEGATVPFIARYRKEATGSLEDTQIAAVRDRIEKLAELDKRRQAIVASLAERDLLTDVLSRKISLARDLATLEDIYLPHRRKRRTRATQAREKGLEPLAGLLFAQKGERIDPASFVDPEKGCANEDDALAGSRDIIAEWVSEDAEVRTVLRQFFAKESIIQSRLVKKNEENGAKFKDYFDWQEPAAKVPSHRLLAMLRGEREKILTLAIRPPEEKGVGYLLKKFSKQQDAAGRQVALAVEDSYKRLLAPSLENELRTNLKARADAEAIAVFAENLRELLLASPLGEKRLLALDPGFRTGAKLVCLDGQGTLLQHATIYPTHGGEKLRQAGETIRQLCATYQVQAIAIGSGTAGRETEAFVRSLNLAPDIVITMVNESGASIYSASDAAREEFPGLDVTIRGAISIGRRLQDPLAELVKIDPKSIGVGQYQHDVDQAELKKSLEDVVESCVNSVGVEVNTASVQLLTFVSGLGPGPAKNIVHYRQENGPFTERQQLRKVPRLGPKAYEQCAGFLRIRGAKNPLDASGVHPERYDLVGQMARDLGCSVAELIGNAAAREKINLEKYLSDAVGLPTLHDIMAELAKPGRDPRKAFTVFQFAEGVNAIEDLYPEMRLPGIVTNVTRFGAFVDIGVHQDGLVHISQLADRFVKDPAEIVKIGQQLLVRVMEIDIPRKRITLSLKMEERSPGVATHLP